jgi:hypothetical protein
LFRTHERRALSGELAGALSRRERLTEPDAAMRTGAMNINERDLWIRLQRLAPKIERLENSIKTGTPDCLVPTEFGWTLLELKLDYGGWIFVQKSQLAFCVRSLKLPAVCRPFFLVHSKKADEVSVFTVREVLGMTKLPHQKGVRLTLPTDRPMVRLFDAVELIGYVHE